MVVMWSIWKERNAICFDACASPLERMMDRAKFLMPSVVSVLSIFKGFSMDLFIFRWREVTLEKGE